MKESAPFKMNFLKTNRFFAITILCFLTFLLSFISNKLAVLMGVGLSFVLVMRGRPEGLLGLFILYYTQYNFITDPHGRSLFRGSNLLTFAGFPISVPIVMCGFVSLRVFLEKFRNPRTYRSKFPQILFWLWLVAFLPVLAGTWMGYQERNINWTRGLRFLMLSGSYFYGYILAKYWPRGKNELLVPVLIPLAVILLSLMALGAFTSHHVFLFLGLAGAFSVYFIQNRSFKHLLVGAMLLILSARIAISGSITTLFIVVFSTLFAYMGMKRTFFFFKRRTKMILGALAIASILFFTFGVVYLCLGNDYNLMAGSGGMDRITIERRIESKVLTDRLPLWSAALGQIRGGPYFVVPSGRPLTLFIPGLPKLWYVGAHNTILEVIRLNGFFSGVVILIIMFWALKNNLLVLNRSTDPALKCLAATVLAVGVIGMTTGDFPADQNVAFFLWGLAGLAHGLFLQDRSYSWHRRPIMPAPKEQMGV